MNRPQLSPGTRAHRSPEHNALGSIAARTNLLVLAEVDSSASLFFGVFMFDWVKKIRQGCGPLEISFLTITLIGFLGKFISLWDPEMSLADFSAEMSTVGGIALFMIFLPHVLGDQGKESKQES